MNDSENDTVNSVASESEDLSRTLTDFLTGLGFDSLDETTVNATCALCLDWLGSALAGSQAQPVVALAKFAQMMGPNDGEAQVLSGLSRSSAYFAALINAASSHVVEQDDLHNASVLHPATVVFPPLLALSQSQVIDGPTFITAAVAGYEAGIRVGEYLGPSHYRIFHTTGTAGTLAAAVAVGKLLGLDTTKMSHAFGSAGTQAAGLWEFLKSAAHSKQLHTAKAAADGMLSAITADFGLTGASNILEGSKGLNAGMLGEGHSARLVGGLGDRFRIVDTSIKYHASCRHTHPAADALLALVIEHDLASDKIASIEAHVYQAAIDVLGPVTDPGTVHQAKFSMGFVLALIAARRSAGVADFTDSSLNDPLLRNLHNRVTMVVDPDIEAAYPDKWSARIVVTTKNGQRLTRKITVPKGDPDNPLSRAELENKFIALATRHPDVDRTEADRLIEVIANLEQLEDVGRSLRIVAAG
ncbi:MAG: hypothetical protein DHS20C01_34640 [marine bacterium B5-7]|nr:MAG: hypothetical protein DHS20C01_34640 [marine bacterium B5-7]